MDLRQILSRFDPATTHLLTTDHIRPNDIETLVWEAHPDGPKPPPIPFTQVEVIQVVRSIIGIFPTPAIFAPSRIEEPHGPPWRPFTAQEVTEKVGNYLPGLDEDATSQILEALTAQGYLSKTGGSAYEVTDLFLQACACHIVRPARDRIGLKLRESEPAEA